MVNIGKWYTKVVYFNEEGEEISASEAKKHYQKIASTKNVKIDGNTGYIEWWHRCQRNNQLRFEL